MFRECVLNTAKRVVGLESFWRMRFNYGKGCMRLAELWRVRFDHCKACMSLAELWRVCILTSAKRVGVL